MWQKSTFFSITFSVLVLTASVHSQPRLNDAINSNLDGSTITITPSSTYKVYCYTSGIILKDWYKINGGRSTFIVKDPTSVPDHVYAKRSASGTLGLHFEPFRTNDIGEYQCRYSTFVQPFALTTLTIFLTTPPTPTPLPTPMPPSKVQGVTISKTAQGSSPALSVSWSAVNGSGITYTVCYSTTRGTQSDPPSGANCRISGITGTSTTLGPLRLGTTYYIWVSAVSSGARGPYSDRQQETTYQVPLQVGPPSITKAVRSGRPALGVSWTEPSSERPITKYQLRYGIKNTRWSTKNVTSRSITLEALSAGTIYDIQVRAVSDVGAGLYSRTSTETTYRAPSQVGPPVLTKEVSSGRPALGVTWTKPSSERTITKYQVQYRRSGSTSWSTKDVTSPPTTLENLSAGAIYDIEVRAVSDVGAGPYSQTSSETTYRVPEQVTGVGFTFNLNNSNNVPTLTITWDSPSSELPITHYFVRLDDTQQPMKVVQDTTLTINGTLGSTYTFRVIAVSAVGSGAWSESVTAQPPSQPAINVTTPSTTTLTVRWDDERFSYRLHVQKKGSTEINTFEDVTPPYNITGLESNTEYTVVVEAYNPLGSANSSAVRYTLPEAVTVPDLAPEGLSCAETKLNSGLLQWTIPLQSGRNGIILQYIIELYAVTSQDGEFQNIKNFTVVLDNPTFDSPSTITYNVTDLSSNTVYRWRVAAINSAGVGLFTTTAGFTTSEEVTDIKTNGLADSDDFSGGLSAGLFVAGLFSGVMAVLLVEGIICGVCKISKMSQKKNIEGDYTVPTNIQMTECPAYESIDREGKGAERLYEEIESRDTKGN